MSFDPDKVERLAPSRDLYAGGIAGPSYMRPAGPWMETYDDGLKPWEGKPTFVKSSDYDQLLQLYRKLQDYCDTVEGLPQNLWSPRRCAGVAASQQQQLAHRNRLA